jgi:hypothetical protein
MIAVEGKLSWEAHLDEVASHDSMEAAPFVSEAPLACGKYPAVEESVEGSAVE